MKKANMHEAEYQQLIEQGWRRRLDPTDRARLEQLLTRQPSARAQWEAEERLTRCLEGLAPAPVSSNFTARVLQAANRIEPRQRSWARFVPRWRIAGLLPRIAIALLTLSLGVLSLHEYQTAANRTRTAQTLASVSRVAKLPEMGWLQDFETISRLSRVEVADTELLSALQ